MAKQLLALDYRPDLILATDMLDLATFLALTRKTSNGIPVALYFHENQITYPWSPADGKATGERNNQYGFINYTSALAADRVFFNSHYHHASFLGELKGFLSQFPDRQGLENVEEIAAKSSVLPLGMDLQRFLPHREKRDDGPPLVLWNHRWEYDKDPAAFFGALIRLKEDGLDFRLALLGEKFSKSPPVFGTAKKELAGCILHDGYVEDFEDYARWLWRADVLPVTSRQDFFGGSTVEAIFCDTYPILPKRLAYPEHLPAHLHEQHFYENEEGFCEKLRQALQDSRRVRAFNGSMLVGKYDWGRLVAHYDQQMEATVRG